MITSLSLNNFKSWRYIKDMSFRRITGLFGANSSGKTSILQLLLMLKQTAESADRALTFDLTGKRGYVDLGGVRDILFQHSINNKFTFQLGWNLQEQLEILDPAKKKSILFSGNELSIYSEISATEQASFLVEELSYLFGEYWFSIVRRNDIKNEYDLATDHPNFLFKRTIGRPWPLPSPVKCYGFPDQVKAYYQNAEFLSHFELAFEKLFGQVFYLGPLREFPKRQYTWGGGRPTDVGRNGERVIEALLASRQRGERINPGFKMRKVFLEEYVAEWLVKLGLVHTFNIKEIAKDSNIYQAMVMTHPWGYSVPITDIGFGVSQVLPVLVLCYYVPEGSTIIMEQPEIHLHPSVQAGLADVFIDAIQTRNIQIVLESHSEHLLRRLQRRIAEEKLSPDDTALYFCNVARGASNIEKLQVDEYGHIRNWPKDFFGDIFSEVAATSEAKLARIGQTNE